ncbi:MAG: asparagine synthase (glutamine-hydrolyzing), partial [Halobacteria archaeon]|nr:asparagine synthase (glutamine-hydrolyzing) [Halobacteria archaeon]
GWTDEDTLDDMLSCITHRGPDETGKFFDDGIMMGMQRLSIIDLEGGSQPVWNEDETVAVVFNGEIYNYRELRNELESKGHTFSTNSDTEVLVHLWEEYGREMPAKLNGMFAFSIWDENDEKLFLARDRLGIKPLYYADVEDGFIWGSELPAVLSAGVDRTLDEKAVYNYFSLHYSPWPRTMFEEIKKLQPGTSLLVSDEGVLKHQYWQLDSTKTVTGSADKIAQKLRKLLEESVERRLIADVPLGAFLSGGLDSSTVVGLMSEMKDEGDVKTFSVAFESESDESEEARYVADYFGTDHHEVTVDLDKVDFFGDLVSHYGEPLPDPAVLPTMVLSEYTKEHVKTVLTGSGADEIFAGYWMHRTIPEHRAKAKYVPKPVFRLADLAAKVMPVGREYIKYAASLESDEKAVVEAAQRFKPLPTNDYIETELDAHESGIYDMVRNSFSYAPENDTLKRISAFYLTHWLPDDILYKVDHATMYASLEARVPFLDHNLVEFTYNIPSKYVARKGEYKPILKRSVSEILPERTLQREKQGFGIQQGEWLRSDHEAIARWLTEDKLGEVPYLDTDRVLSLWSEHRKGNEDYGITLWKILNFVAWYYEYAYDT